jgi:hypothetical protein
MVQYAEIEKIAVQVAIAHEEAQWRVVESLESENRWFYLISRRLHPEDAKTAIDVRIIEAKGRGGRDGAEIQRVPHGSAALGGPLALRRLQLRHHARAPNLT